MFVFTILLIHVFPVCLIHMFTNGCPFLCGNLYVFIFLLTAASRFVGLSLVQNLFLGVELSLVQNVFLKHDPFRDRRSRGGAAECVS